VTDQKLLKVFVYGTLKQGGFFSKRFDDFRCSNRPGSLKGSMYSIDGSFPGLKLVGDTIIKGEVHEYNNSSVVEQLFDRIEGYQGKNNKNNFYDKEIVLVTTAEGEEPCIAYVFAGDISEFQEVKDGEWKI